MEDKDIIKALKCCAVAGNCDGCGYSRVDTYDIFCVRALVKDALDLIKRQQAEIERLKNKILEDDRLLNDRVQESINKVCSANQKYTDVLEKAFNDRTEELQTAKAEIKRLQKDLIDWKDIAHRETGYVEIAKSEAVREFAERLKKWKQPSAEYGNYIIEVVTVKDIDNLVKEMAGDEE